MPLYEYECEKCGKIEERLQKFSDKPLTRCTHCSGRLHKLISQSSFHLKGTGWYVTDYAGNGKNRSADTGKTDPPSSKSSPEAQPAAKSGDAKGTSPPAAAK